MMTGINVQTICETWYNTQQRNCGGLERINLSRVTRSILNGPIWSGTQSSTRPQIHTYSLTNLTSRGAYANITDEAEHDRFYKVQLQRGICQGYPGQMTLNLPPVYDTPLGPFILFDPSEMVTEKHQPLKTTVTGGIFAQPYARQSVHGELEIQLAELHGSFHIKVGLKGFVMYATRNGPVIQQQITQIVRDMKQRMYPGLGDLTIEDDRVCFDMAGLCEIKWDCHKELVLTQ